MPPNYQWGEFFKSFTFYKIIYDNILSKKKKR